MYVSEVKDLVCQQFSPICFLFLFSHLLILIATQEKWKGRRRSWSWRAPARSGQTADPGLHGPGPPGRVQGAQREPAADKGTISGARSCGRRWCSKTDRRGGLPPHGPQRCPLSPSRAGPSWRPGPPCAGSWHGYIRGGWGRGAAWSEDDRRGATWTRPCSASPSPWTQRTSWFGPWLSPRPGTNSEADQTGEGWEHAAQWFVKLWPIGIFAATTAEALQVEKSARGRRKEADQRQQFGGGGRDHAWVQQLWGCRDRKCQRKRWETLSIITSYSWKKVSLISDREGTKTIDIYSFDCSFNHHISYLRQFDFEKDLRDWSVSPLLDSFLHC